MDLKYVCKVTLWTLFPPESYFERRLRTLYHRLASSSFIINLKIQNSRKSYKGWLTNQRNQIGVTVEPDSNEFMFSFILAADASSLDKTRKTLNSIIDQSIKNWEIIVVCSKEMDTVTLLSDISFEKEKVRFVFEEINVLPFSLDCSSGDYFLCCKSGDFFETNFLYECNRAIRDYPEATVYYTDVDEFISPNASPLPFFKPALYSPELHLSINYLSSALFIKNKAHEKCKFINPSLCLGNQEWELAFLLSEDNNKFQHIPLVLVHKDATTAVNALQECQVLESHLNRIGISNNLVIERNPKTKIRWTFDEPSISIIIPTKNKLNVLKHLLDSLFKFTDYKNYEIVLVDNNSDEIGITDYYSQLENNYPVKVVHFNEEFNYSKALNLGASQSNSDILLFLNNDMEITHSDWLTELCQWLMIKEIGIVGAKLLHENNSIQHAGVILGLQGFIGHLYLNTPDHYQGLLGSVDWYRDFYAVTGACQMIRKSLFSELGGYDERFKLVFSDIELCLRAITKGYRVLYTPNTIIKHLEGKSRGYKSPRGDLLLGYELLGPWILSDDPYFSPNLTYSTIPDCRSTKEDFSQRIDSINLRKKFLSIVKS